MYLIQQSTKYLGFCHVNNRGWEAVKQQLDLVLGEIFQPSLLIYTMQRVAENAYVELSELLPEKIQEASHFPDGKKKKKVQPMDKFDDWVLALLCIAKPSW